MNTPPNDQSRLVKCRCQNCDGHIEFDASGFRPGETRKVECPHCNLETILFHRPKPIESAKPDMDSLLKGAKAIGGIQSFMTGQFEKFVFALVRFFAVFWAAVIVLGFLTCTVNYIGTFFPSKGEADQPKSLLGQAIQSPALENLGIYLGGLFILFCVLTMISFALLLLAIERNTRNKE